MKPRIIPVALLKNSTSVFTSHLYSPWRSFGSLAQFIKLQVARQADEILVIDIEASLENREVDDRVFKLLVQNTNIPVSVCGGIMNVQTAINYIEKGADKVVLGIACLSQLETVAQITSILGVQSVSMRLDYKYSLSTGEPELYDYRSKSLTGRSIKSVISNLITCPVGEIILSDVSRDGSLKGLDIQIMRYFQSVNCPVVLSCGAGHPDHFYDAFACKGVSAVAASSIFAYTKETPASVKDYLVLKGIDMRRI